MRITPAGERRSRLAAGLVTVAAVIGIAGSCAARGNPVGPIQAMQECPAHSATHAAMVPSDTTAAADIQEYHDCQRLQRSNNPRQFGALAGIWSVEEVRQLTLADFQQPGGALVAHVELFDGTEPWLEFAAGTNCIYLKRVGNQYEARVVPAPSATCARTLAAWPSGNNIRAREDRVPGASAADYPPVARWVSAAGRHFMGVRCLDAWCTIGRGVPPAIATSTGGMHRRIPGWYDRQYVAVGTAGNLTPSTSLATILPDSMLGSRTINDHFNCRRLGPDGCALDNLQSWVPAATAFSDDSIPGYKQKMNLSHDAMNPSWIYLRYDPQAAADQQWQARVVVRNGTTRYFAVDRTPQPRRPPAVARWLWDPNDERYWIACDAGCCTVSPRDLMAD